MKKVLSIMSIVFFALQLSAQQDDNIRNQRIDELSKNIIQIEKNLNDNNRKVETIRKSQFSLEENVMRKISEYEVANDSKLAEFELQMQQFVKENSSELSELKEEFAAQKKLREKMHKRQKIHFLVIYILLFASMMGVVFIYVYYGKMMKDYDIFHLKKIEDLKAETHRTVDANQKYLISKVDTSTDEVRGLIQKNNENLETLKKENNEALSVVSAESDKRYEKLEKSLQAATNEQKEMQKLIAENAKLGTLIHTLSEKLLGIEKETKIQIEELKKAKPSTTAKPKVRATKKPGKPE
jgi:hypothetical protein